MSQYTANIDYNAQPFGVDVSSNQGQIDWQRMATAPIKVEFAAIRLGISWGYVDKWFPHNWAEAKRAGIPRMAYHVLYPAQPIQPQLDNIARTLAGDFGELPFVADIELQHGCTSAQMQAAARAYVEGIRDLTGRVPIIYTRTIWWNDVVTGFTPLKDLGWYAEYYWWIALYLTSGAPHPGPILVPRGVPVDRVLIHQVADHTPSAGFGIDQAAAKMLDYNRWLKPREELHRLAGYIAPTQPEPPQPVESQLDRIERKIDELLAKAG